MRKPKKVSEKCIYRVVTTEFWRNTYQVEAENHGAALVVFEILKQTKALPAPQRMLLGVIDPPEEVQDADGQTVYTNYPPGDDAERMLFVEMWVRMLEAQMTSEYAVKVSVLFICRMKQWDPTPLLEEVRARTNA